MNDIKFELAKVNDIPIILEIIKERCDWFLKNKIQQKKNKFFLKIAKIINKNFVCVIFFLNYFLNKK